MVYKCKELSDKSNHLPSPHVPTIWKWLYLIIFTLFSIRGRQGRNTFEDLIKERETKIPRKYYIECKIVGKALGNIRRISFI